MNPDKLNISILGNGGISKAIQHEIINRGHKILTVIDQGDDWSIDECDLVIEATIPNVVLSNIDKLARKGKDMVIVTTGWYDRLDDVRQIIEKHRVRAIWSSNFSIGVNLYFKIIEMAAKVVNKVEEYDIWGTEIHHRNKIDSPSGTAKVLENILLNNIDRKTSVVEDALQRKLENHELHFSSTRGGTVNFEHRIGFDSDSDAIEIKHMARNRGGYALGAVKAAEWISNQKPGFYSMNDFLKDTFS